MTTASATSKAEVFELIKLRNEGKVGVITINRPKQLNALNTQVMKEVCSAAAEMDKDNNIHVIIITGEGNKAFAAGADIKEMVDMDYPKGADISEHTAATTL
ncbi:hypothetical protein WJX72_009578 [[Myrmecia] bisecta]|uniref:Enoyl-CoA hydratase n=1 Tax=[Myrmecia] bisecta TaxID=41462 RepID=A0AAW1PCZ8_9CHLO